MNVKGAKPGRYTPRCSKCGQTFSVTVPEGGGPMIATPLVPPQPAPAASDPPSPPAAESVTTAGITAVPAEGADNNPDFSVSPPANLGGTAAGPSAAARPNVTENLGATLGEGEESAPAEEK